MISWAPGGLLFLHHEPPAAVLPRTQEIDEFSVVVIAAPTVCRFYNCSHGNVINPLGTQACFRGRLPAPYLTPNRDRSVGMTPPLGSRGENVIVNL